MLKSLFLSCVLLFPMLAFADILPDNAEPCQTAQLGDRCEYGDLKMGVCAEEEHCRPSPFDMEIPCSKILVCKESTATTAGATAGTAAGATAGTAAGATAGATAGTTAGATAGATTTSTPKESESDDSCASTSTRTELFGLISLVLGLVLVARTRKLS